MPNGLFLALYRIALRLAPRVLRDRHAREQVELIHRMLEEEAPGGFVSGTTWKLTCLTRTAWAGVAAHVDLWRLRPALNGVGGDIRLALRSLRRSPWYAGSTVIVLGAGMALAAVVFAIVDGVLFKPLPYPHADRLFLIDARPASQPTSRLSAMSSVETGMWTASVPEMTMTAVGGMAGPFKRRDGVDQLMRTVDEHFFDVVGIRPKLGSFLPEDFDWRDRAARPGPTPMEMYWPVIISHELWRREYGLDPSVIGRRITRSERDGNKFGHIIRGVLPADFVFPLDTGGRQPDVLSPEGISLTMRQADRRRNYYVLARVGVEAPVLAIETRLREVTQRESRQHPSTDNAAQGAVDQPPFDTLRLVPIAEHLGASARSPLQLIAGGVALLLLIICLNVTGLAAARGVDRAADFATRRALGASSWRLARLVGLEVLVLVVAGVGLGLWLGTPLLKTTLGLLPESLVLLKVPVIDMRAIGAMAIATVICALSIAALPALRASRLDVAPVRTGRAGRKTRAIKKGGLVLIAAQAALGFILLTAGALATTSLALAWNNDVGFTANRTVLLEAYLLSYKNNQDAATKLADASTRLSQLPGVTGLAASNIHMFSEMFSSGWAPTGSAAVQGTVDHQVEQTFFDVMGLRAIEGRLPGKEEWSPNGPFAVISETTARLWWPGETTVVGRRVHFTRRGTQPERTVVAVVRDARYESLDREPLGSVYLPIDFEGRYGAVFVVRTQGDPADVMPGLLAVARETGLNLERAVPVDEGFFVANVHRALPAWLFGSLGIVGLVVLAVGTFGLLAMSAAQRTKELVIRVALGASSTNVIGLLVRDQLTAVVIGLGAGAAVSFWTVALLESQLYRVSPFSAPVWIASASLLLGVALVATLLPSIGRSRVNPAEALRAE